MGALQHVAALWGQVGLAERGNGVGEEAGMPGLAGGQAAAGLVALALLNLLLQLRGAAELAPLDGFRDAEPEAERFVGQLLRVWRDDFGMDREGAKVDEQRRRVLFGETAEVRKKGGRV